MRNIFRRKKTKAEHSRVPRPCKYSQALREVLEKYRVSESMPERHPDKMANQTPGAASDNALEKKYGVAIPGSVTTPSLIRTLEPNKIYPYAVIRYLPACYGAFPIKFLSNESQQPKYEDSWQIVMPKPYRNGKLSPEARQAVLDITEAAFNRMHGRYRMCAVFAEDDCVYFELDGSRTKGTSAPRMTIGDAGSSRKLVEQ